jgi:pimeloyl-ACP methyl ester carboxylesterase
MTKPAKRGRIVSQAALALAAATAVAAGLIGCGSSGAPAAKSGASRVAVDGSSVNVLCTGSSSTKPTIVLLAGEEDPLTKFASLQAVLSRTTRVCSYDRPGEGASAKPAGGQTLSDSATLLDDLLNAEKVSGKVVVVGHSLGGLIAAQFAHQYPGRVAAVVLLDASAPSVGGAIESMIPASATGIPAGVRAEVGSLASATTNSEGLVYAGQPIGSLGAIPLTVVQHGQQIYRAVPRYGNELQVIWAKGQQQWAGLSSNSKLVTATSSGHYIYLDQQALSVQLIEHAAAA